MTRISTPCIRLCVLDPATGLCEGCGRSALEIGRWSAMSEAERRRIMAGLRARKREAFGDRAPRPDLA